ncbi:MAG TPA: TonB-dependent receptor [Bryobacteraceae bacterium]|nr:TonB-dependent receptor [Bryobacteraceae bacterium]
MGKPCRVALGFLAFISLPAASFGQAVFGSIVGTVTDSTNAAIPHAKITIRDVGKGVTYNGTTNDTGNYSQTHLIVGLYEVRVEAQGFETFVQQNVNVEVDANTQVNVQLHPGAVGETVSVTAEVPLLKTERSDVSDTITQKAVMELPVFSRDVSKLYFLVPGVQATGTTAASEQPQDIYRPSIGGQYWGGISFQLDGTDNRESVLGEPVITPNLDSVSELKITTTAYDAEFGQASQAVISAQTKSGSNMLHGGGFWYRRDQHGAARDPFAQSVPIVGSGGQFLPPQVWNQFGGSLGGPIQKDKTFFFGDYQGTAQKNGGSLLTRVPTAAERGGDLSDLATPIFNPCPGLTTGVNCNVDPSVRQQFTGGVIPASLLSPQALALLQLIPLPNLPGATGSAPNYSASGAGIVNWNSFDVRIDRYQTEKLHMFGRYSFLGVNQTNPGAFGLEAGGPTFSTTAFSGAASLRDQSLSYGIDYVVKPNWLTDFRFGFFRYRVFVNPNGLGTSPAKDAGIPGLNLDSFYTSGMPAFYLQGTGGFNFGYALNVNSCNCPLNEQENEFQWVSNTTHNFGNHALKFGVDVRFQQNLRVPSDSHRSGEITFSATTTEGPNGGGLGLASYLLGDVGTFARYVSNSTEAAERQKRLFTYIQDTWRITPKLTVNYGLRWEIYFPQYVNAKDSGGFQSIKTGEVLIAGENGIGLNGNIDTSLTHFAPRLGISYQLDPKTVIRTGYGRSYDVGVFGVSFGHNVTQNVPVLANQSLNPANPWLPVFTLNQGPTSLDPTTILATQPKGATGNPILPNGIAPNVLPWTSNDTMRLPVVDAWNFTVEHQFTASTVLSVAYVGNHGYHVTAGGTNYNINQPSIVGFGTLNTNQRRLFYNEFGWTQSIKYFADDSSVKFNSLQVRGEKRFTGGLQITGNFTWASAFDYANDYFYWNHNIDYGREGGVRRFVFNLTNVYELPFGKGKYFLKSASKPVDLIAGGWQLSGIWLYESGAPFTPSYTDCGKDEDTGPCRPNLVGSGSVPNPSASGWYAVATPGTTGTGCLATANATPELNANGCTRGPWSRPAAGTFGNVARDSFFGPHLFNADLSLSKNFHITERIGAQFRAELFNAFNHVNLGQPNASVDSPTAGQIFSIAGLTQMRKWQFGLRANF